jgi:hypothetical protein
VRSGDCCPSAPNFLGRIIGLSCQPGKRYRHPRAGEPILLRADAFCRVGFPQNGSLVLRLHVRCGNPPSTRTVSSSSSPLRKDYGPYRRGTALRYTGRCTKIKPWTGLHRIRHESVFPCSCSDVLSVQPLHRIYHRRGNGSPPVRSRNDFRKVRPKMIGVSSDESQGTAAGSETDLAQYQPPC